MVDVLIQTFNESLNLAYTLASVRGLANQVFVVDCGSTDGTQQLAESMGARVVHHDWEGYARQKNWAIDNLPFESEWILVLDADESLSDGLREEIREITSGDPQRMPEVAFHINRVLVFLGRKIWHCGYFPSWNMRLFRRGKARYEDRAVHEHMIATGPVGRLKHLIFHEDRRGLEHFSAKHNRYSTLEAKALLESREYWPGLRRLLGDSVIRRRFIKHEVIPLLPMPWLWRFLYMYVLRLGFLDGLAGWRLCWLISNYEFLIHLKFSELKRQHGVKMPPAALRVAEGTVVAERQAVTTPSTNVREAVPIAGHVSPSVSRELSSPAQERKRVGKVPVSVIIPTLNEERNLARCLDHLEWANEVVVVDSGSKDKTTEIARRYGARVIDFRWNGQWPKKKNWALRHAELQHEWVLIVDADEWIIPELADEVAHAIKGSEKVGYYVNRKFIFLGGWIKRCGYYPSWNLRLIKRGFGEYEQLTGIGDTGSGDNEVHEHVIVNGDVGYLKHDMLHFAFPNIHTFMEKHNRYSNWEAAVQFKGTHTTSAAIGDELSRRRRLKNLSRRLPFRPMLRFLYAYVWKGGFMDGMPGYIFCRLLAIYEYLSVAKYIELRRAESDQHSADRLSEVPPADLGGPAPGVTAKSS